MDVAITRLPESRLDGGNIEIVECKGLGHPDTICDALAEEVSLALCRHYRDRFGHILHHNVDKVLLRGGQAQARFGGGRVIEPIDIYLAGRATDNFQGQTIPITAIATEACQSWLRRNMHALVVKEHVRVHNLIRPGSADLTELFARAKPGDVPLANDTSCGVGYAPLSATEQTALAVSDLLSARSADPRHAMIGEDVKVMAVRTGGHLALTVACAHISEHIHDMSEYLESKRSIADAVRQTADRACSAKTEVEVNSADGPTPESIYLTVTGTSAEAGDDGEAGRGNRINGLITPHRPMTMESVAGKNPINHVGKLYNICASLVAESIAREIPEAGFVECYMVSRIGHPIDRPQIVEVRLARKQGASKAMSEADIGRVVDRHLADINNISDQLISGKMGIGKWPLR